MPGAPNRPPEVTPDAPRPPPVPGTAQQKALRRLAPDRVALLLDVWKGAPSPELLAPFSRAEAAYAGGDFDGAASALDGLSIRFAEPRWPTMPEPFRRLRVAIPAPMPPHWDPDHALPPAEKDLHRARRGADDQLALASAAVVWGSAHGIDTADLTTALNEATAILPVEGPSAGFYERIDRIWTAVRDRFPLPKGLALPARAPGGATAEAGEA